MGIFIHVDGIPAQRRVVRMLAIRITGNQLRAGRALAGLSMEDLADRAKLCRRSISKWEGSSNAVPDAMVGHLCRALDVLEGEARGLSGDGVSALSGGSPDYLMEAVPPSINSNDSKGLHLAARARHARVSHARHERGQRRIDVLELLRIVEALEGDPRVVFMDIARRARVKGRRIV
jgi:transcriptional regulator with XRE-family HTH domain